MIILLDVDRVLLKTDLLKRRITDMAQAQGAATDTLRTVTTLEKINEKDPSFLQSLVYEDVKDFFDWARQQGHEIHLITSARSQDTNKAASEEQQQFQKRKLALTGIADLVPDTSHITVEADCKKQTLSKYQVRPDVIFVDDATENIRDAQEFGIPCLKMVRDITPFESIEAGGVQDLNGVRQYIERMTTE